jgi:carbon starvation protein
LGGINTFWPIFGVANQLLAVIALSLGTTVLLKMGRQRYAWVPLLPLAWLLTVTMTAGYQKIFAADPRLGFLKAAAVLQDKIAAGGTPKDLATWHHQVFNNQVNTAVTATFLLLVVLIVAANVRVWWKILVAKETLEPKEAPFLTEAEVVRGEKAEVFA